MAETVKPKPRRRSKTQTPAGKSRTRTAAKPDESQEPAAEASAKTAEQTTASNGEHVKITPPALTKRSSGAWLFSFLLIIVIVGVGHVTWPRWQPYMMAYAPDGLNIGFDDSRVDGLTARIGELESKTISLYQRDKEIVRLEGEREELQQSLAGVLEHIESLERSIFAVKEMAKAATTATVDEAAAASHGLKELNERLRKLEIAPAPAQSGNPAFASRLDKLEKDRTLEQELFQRVVKLEKSSTRSRQELAETLNQLNASRQTLQKLEGRVASVEAVDDKTVTFTLTDEFAPFLAALVQLSIVDSALVKENASGDDYASDWLSANSAGSGAYVVTEHDPQVETVMVPNENYNGQAMDAAAPDEVTYRYSLEASTVRALMARGEHDISCASGRAERVWVQDHGTARRSGQALRTCVATGCEAANYEAQPAVQRWRSEQPPRGYCTLRHRGQPLRLRVAGFWMPASARQQPTQRRRPAHTSSERRRSTLCRDPTHRNRHGEYLANFQSIQQRSDWASPRHLALGQLPTGVEASSAGTALPCCRFDCAFWSGRRS